jgi:glycosyltransferase involved in cell wall biosynthesis
MIVKDETHIIHECLESMVPYIDRYDITDTGSTDGTPEKIKETMDKHGIPGEVYLSDWKGFGKSRTEAFENARKSDADYAWVIDADDKVTGDFKFPDNMDADAYSLKIGRPEFTWFRNQIFKLEKPWRYVGILHEYAECKDCPKLKQGRLVGDYFIEARTMGARNLNTTPVEKYTKDANQLYSALNDETDPNYDPTNSRYQFYLAQSYFDSQQFEKAKEAYQKRVDMGGWEEEVFYSLFRIAIVSLLLKEEWEKVHAAFLEAWDFRPIRAEPLYELARLYRSAGKPRLGYLYARMACTMPYPEQDILFIGTDVYEWKALDEVGSCAFYCHRYKEGYDACRVLVEKKNIPENEMKRIKSNFKHYEKKLTEIQMKQNEHQMVRRQEEKKLKKSNKTKKPTYKKRKKK